MSTSLLEEQAAGIHDRVIRPLAERLAFDPGRPFGVGIGPPVILVLGNHSSGKSSFINYLLGQPVQTTGLAPTDDGFTLLTWGAQNATSDGPTVATHPRLNLVELNHLGPAFTSKLRLKTVLHDLLRSVTLVDSPGMIDAAGPANTRGYDFPAAVRLFAERADLILFFFDPDKPGTTAEAISILTQTLAGLGYKLILVMNKVDQFGSFRDFARTYGTLCWNLAKAIPTKDIPHIATSYIPSKGTAIIHGNGGLPLDDFDASRAEILAEVRRTPGRRADNIVTDLMRRARELLLHARVCRELTREYRRLWLQWAGALVLTLLLAGVAGWLAWSSPNLTTRFGVIAIGVAAVGAAWWVGRWQTRRFARRSVDRSVLDNAFTAACHAELTLKERADLRADWEAIRDRTWRSLRLVGPGRLSRRLGLSRQIARLERALNQDIPGMRREIGGNQPELPLTE